MFLQMHVVNVSSRECSVAGGACELGSIDVQATFALMFISVLTRGLRPQPQNQLNVRF
jgi:hypothetical protein